jgi:hypothetical protein
MRYTSVRYIPMGLYAHEVHADEIQACEVHTDDIHTHEMQACEIHAIRCKPMRHTPIGIP